MTVLDLYAQQKKDKDIKESSLNLLVSAFLSLAEETLERDQKKEADDETLSIPLSTHNYSFDK
jgi:hypothetical protein